MTDADLAYRLRRMAVDLVRGMTDPQNPFNDEIEHADYERAVLTLRTAADRLAAEPIPALVCGVHLYAVEGEAPPAVTVIEGYAVCEDHAGLVAQGERFAGILAAARMIP
jgi:hypothetical protein